MLLSIGFVTFQNIIIIKDLGAEVRIKVDISITSVSSMTPLSDTITTFILSVAFEVSFDSSSSSQRYYKGTTNNIKVITYE